MFYSSGTTGRPKGVLREYEAIPLEEAENVVAMMCVLLLGMSEESVYLSPAPLYHAAPLRFTMAAHLIGSTAVVMERFDAAGFLAAVERHSATHTQVVPTMLVRSEARRAAPGPRPVLADQRPARGRSLPG